VQACHGSLKGKARCRPETYTKRGLTPSFNFRKQRFWREGDAMCSRRLYKLLVNQMASVWLIEQWWERNARCYPLTAVKAFESRPYFLFVSFVTFALSFVAWVFPLSNVLELESDPVREGIFGALLIFGFASAAALFLRSFFTPHVRSLIKDLKLLAKHICHCGGMSKAELKDEAVRVLVVIAVNILNLQDSAKEAENKGDPEGNVGKAAKYKEEAFKPLHAVLFRFGLVVGIWDPFFTMAREQIEADKKRAAERSTRPPVRLID
jgi:hypothetical protein